MRTKKSTFTFCSETGKRCSLFQLCKGLVSPWESAHASGPGPRDQKSDSSEIHSEARAGGGDGAVVQEEKESSSVALELQQMQG